METFIRAYDNTLNLEFCQQLIDVFEASPNKHQGVTSAGVVQPNKRSIDMFYDVNVQPFKQIDAILHASAVANFKLYFKEFERYFRTVTQKFDDTGFCFRKYEKNIGGFDEHSDVGGISTANRALAFMWYLNDVEEGGETEFIAQNIKIKPKAGRLAIFPANWTHLHKGNAAMSNDKYIVNSFLVMMGD